MEGEIEVNRFSYQFIILAFVYLRCRHKGSSCQQGIKDGELHPNISIHSMIKKVRMHKRKGNANGPGTNTLVLYLYTPRLSP
jgi:hypothetical protein